MLRCFVRRFSTAAYPVPSPLTGVTVVDLTRILAGPFCTMLLGDLGARVIKIEHPDGGDETRRWGPPFVPGTNESCYFLSVNRNKESLSVNIQRPEGQEIVRRLVSNSDVFVENFIPGKLEKYGLGYGDLRDVNERLVYCSLTGFGSDGPDAKRAGYDLMAASIGGLLGVTGPEGGEPAKVGVAMTDLTTGLYAHGAILAALLHRDVTGRGQWVQTNLLASQVSCMVNLASNYLNAGQEAKRHGTAHASIVPYQSFLCSDGQYMTVGALSDVQFKKFCSIIGHSDLAEDVRFLRNSDRVTNREALLSTLKAAFREKTVDEWEENFRNSGLPYGPVNTLGRVFRDEQVKHLGMVKEVEHPTAGTVKVCGPAVKYSMSKCDVVKAPPLLGQHTDEILKSLGYDEEQIRAYHVAGVV